MIPFDQGVGEHLEKRGEWRTTICLETGTHLDVSCAEGIGQRAQELGLASGLEGGVDITGVGEEIGCLSKVSHRECAESLSEPDLLDIEAGKGRVHVRFGHFLIALDGSGVVAEFSI